jgi:hypothetical protein
MLLFVLKPGISKGNEDLKAELQKVLKEHSVTEWKIQESNNSNEKTAKFDTIKDTIKDPYDQIKSYVDVQDTAYFMQLKKHMETKDSSEQIKCKAVVYAILQDTILTTEQKKILSLGQFEILARMTGSDYRFSKKSSTLTTTDTKYKERTQRYYAYKNHLQLLDLKEEIKKLDQELKLLQKLLD